MSEPIVTITEYLDNHSIDAKGRDQIYWKLVRLVGWGALISSVLFLLCSNILIDLTLFLCHASDRLLRDKER